jgi:hypothetical protein
MLFAKNKSRRASRKNRNSSRRVRRHGGSEIDILLAHRSKPAYTTLLDMNEEINKQYKGLEFRKIIAKLTKGIDIGDVDIDMYTHDAKDGEYSLVFSGKRDDVNNIIRQMKGRVLLKNFDKFMYKTFKKRK